MSPSTYVVRALRHRVVPGVCAAVAVVSLAAVPATTGSASVGPARGRTACDAAVHLSKWSLNRLSAQVVVVPIQADQAGALTREARTGYGGILLFGTSAPASLGTTLRQLQAISPQDLGISVMTDEEGGGVMRLDNLVTAFPWARTMARTMSAAQITATARRVGTQLLRAGVTMDLAPVLDIDGRDVVPGASDPDGYRSFGGTVPVVVTDGEAFAAGLSDAGVIPVVKHFPGLGGSTGNTDDGPASTKPWSVLRASALHTFETAINRGAPAIMVANARVPGLTALPASLSHAVMVGVLRDWLHFKGLIMTDTLTAGAISAVPLSVQAAAVDALNAGADLVLLGAQPSVGADVAISISVSNAIARAVTSGRLPRSTLARAVAHDLAVRGVEVCAGE
jgi:beta-N-acetylhexosaminidase